MGLLSRIFRKRPKEAEQPAQMDRPPGAEPPYLTQTTVTGTGDPTVYFVDEARGIRRLLVDQEGCIQNFPDIVEQECWLRKVTEPFWDYKIRYDTTFEPRPWGWRMLWKLQPDGSYWQIEGGYGPEIDKEIVLYTDIDLNGEFTAPFRIYRVGDVTYAAD